MRFFNTAGPVRPGDHYCIPPLERFDLEEVLALVRMKKYFVLHAPRQTGKTSALLALRDLLQRAGLRLRVHHRRGGAHGPRRQGGDHAGGVFRAGPAVAGNLGHVTRRYCSARSPARAPARMFASE